MKKTLKTVLIVASVMVLSATFASAKSKTAKGDSATESTVKKEKTKKEKAPKAEKEKEPKANKEKAPKTKKVKFDQVAYDEAFASGDYATCISMLQGKGSKRDVILNELDADMLMHLNGSYLDSAKAFLNTQGEMMQKNLKDDKSGGTYAGTVYERLLSYAMRAANAFALGDASNAKGVMDSYTGDYKDIIAALVTQEKELEEDSEGSLESDDVKNAMNALEQAGLSLDLKEVTSKKPQKYTGKNYDTSAFLSYLGTLAYAANGDADHAKDFANVLKTVNSAVDVSEDVSVPAGMGRLDVVALSGTIGKRSESVNQFTVGTVPIANTALKFKITYPVFEKQNHAISSVRVTLSNGNAKTAMLVEDFDAAVAIDVAKKARRDYNRSVARNITKNSAAAVAGIGAVMAANAAIQKANNPLTAKAYDVAITKLNEALDAIVEAEKADVRQGSYFPHKASAAGFTVSPGTYSVKVEYLSGNNVVETKEVGDIVVEAGKPTVVVSTCER